MIAVQAGQRQDEAELESSGDIVWVQEEGDRPAEGSFTPDE
jgi:hypothetical protein